MGRSPYCKERHTRKVVWNNGEGCWRRILKASGFLTSAQSCRGRWNNPLQPNLKRDKFTGINELKNYRETHLKGKLYSRGQQNSQASRNSISCLSQREICDPLIGDGGSASVHVASNRVTRDLNAVMKEDDASANSISESTNFSIWERGVAVGNSSNNNNVPVRTRDFLSCFNNCNGSSLITPTEQYLEPNIRKFHEQEQYDSIIPQICDPPIGDGGSASVHVASNRVTRDLNEVKKEDDASTNSISESTNFSIWERGVAVVNSSNNNNVLVWTRDFLSCFNNCDDSSLITPTEQYLEPNIRKFHEQEQYDNILPQICDPPIRDSGSASVHVASNRVTRDLNAVKKEDAADANSISESTNFSKWEKGEERIGAGGFGTVYVARNSYKRHVVFFISDRKTGASCAVKELKDIDKPESIQKEIKILSQLEHPNIVKYYGHEIDGNKISVYMEFIQPGSLKKYISKRGGALHETLIRKFTAQILAGLVYLKSKRVVHRDLKPDNILVNSQDTVKLVDFGVSKHLAESVGNHSRLGTLYYAAPEVLQKTEYKSSCEAYAADIWSLGCVIIEMLSGKHHWPDCEQQQAGWKVVGEGQCPSIPDELCSEGKDFLERCFIRIPADRPSAVELQDHPFVRSQNLSC